MGKTGRGDEKDMGGIRNIHLSLAFPEGQAHGVVMRRAAT